MFNNKTKTFLLLTLIFVAICGLSAATAVDIDNNATDTASIATETTQISEESTASQASDNSVQTDVSNKNINKKLDTNVKSDSEATFADLATDITGSEVTLTKDYTQGSGEVNITITENKEIDGDGHTITANNGIFIINSGVTLTLKNTNIVSHHGSSSGVYIFDLYNKGNLIVNNCSFTYDSTERTYGGFVWTGANTNLTVTGSVFDGSYGVRSQIYSDGNNANVKVDGCTFTHYYENYGAIDINKKGNLTVTNSIFANNNGGMYAGAIVLYNKDIVAVIDNNVFENLTSQYRGGAIYAGGTVNVTNNKFKNLTQTGSVTYRAGLIWIETTYSNVTVENNTAEDINAGVADYVFRYSTSKLITKVHVTGQNVSVDQENPVKLVYNVTDDSGNSIQYLSNPFTMKINDETVPVTYTNGVLTAEFDASYEPGNYTITFTYDDSKFDDEVIIPETTLEVRDIGIISYSEVQALIDAADDIGGEVSITRPVYRKSTEDYILIPEDKWVIIDFNGNLINAKNGRVFVTESGANTDVTIKNAIVTNVGNKEANLTNTEGRFLYANNSGATVENVTFINNSAPYLGSSYSQSSKGSLIFLYSETPQDKMVTLNDCTIENATSTFINNYQGIIQITGSEFKNNNLGSSCTAIIANGGELIIDDTTFINNTANDAIVYGKSQQLSIAYTFSPLTIDDISTQIIDSTFINNTCSNWAGAVCANKDLSVSGSVFVNNHLGATYNYGGAISSYDGNLEVDKCIFENNSARYYTSWSGVLSVNPGTAIYNDAGDLTVSNSLIVSNITEVAAIQNAASDASISLENNFWGNETPEGFYNSTGDEITINTWAFLYLGTQKLDGSEINYNDDVYAVAMLVTNNKELVDFLPDYGVVTFQVDEGELSQDSEDMTSASAYVSFKVKNSPYTVTANYLGCEATTTGTAVMPEPQVHVLNDGNWTYYFNDDGTINDAIVVPNSELRFEGVFNNRNMIISVPVNITTADTQAVLNNCTIIVNNNNVNITKLEMNGDDINSALITLYNVKNAYVGQNNLTVTGSADHVTTHAVDVTGGENNVIEDNIINVTGPENNVIYSDFNYLYTTAIAAVGSNTLTINNNEFTIKTNGKESEDEYGTIYGVHITGTSVEEFADDIIITNNIINTESSVYTYGLDVDRSSNVFIENNTITTNGEYYADGMQLFYITDSVINNNTVTVKATTMGYGIILNGYMDWDTYETFTATNNVVSNNTVNVESNDVWAIESVIATNSTVQENDVTVNAINGMGIGILDTDHSIVTLNNVTLTVTMTQAANTGDAVSSYPTGIRVSASISQIKSATYNNVTYNRVIVDAPEKVPAVNASTYGIRITDNFLVSPLGKGDDAAVNTGYGGAVENNQPGPVTLTDDTYTNFFNEDCTLKEEYNYYTLKAEGNFLTNTVFIFDNVNVIFTTDDSILMNGIIYVGNDAKVEINGFRFVNSMDAIVLESDGNIINNTMVIINSEDPIHAIYVTGDDNVITNTLVYVEAPSGDVEYDNTTWAMTNPAPAGIVVTSSGNLVDNVTVYFDGTNATGTYPTVNGIYFASLGDTISANTLKDSSVIVKGSNYTYGVNVGTAKDTLLDNVFINVTGNGAYAIQLFGADNITATGNLYATSDSYAYGVYTGMGNFKSDNVNFTGLNMTVEAPEAWAVKFEGASNVVLADSTYDVTGSVTKAIDIYPDYMYNVPENITVTGLTVNISPEEESDMIYFGNVTNIALSDNTFTSTNKSNIVFNIATNATLTDSTITNATITTLDESNLVIDNIILDNTNMQAVLFTSTSNILNNSKITVKSNEALRVVEFDGDNNIIENTVIDAVIPSADVPYNKDYIGQPISSALYISSSNNLVNNVSVTVDGSEIVNGSKYPTIDAIDVQSKAKAEVIENNIIKQTTVKVSGPNYVYGINLGRAKDTTIEDVTITAESDYYADAIQLFDANNVTISGQLNAKADKDAYAIYATAMAVGSSNGIYVNGVEATVEAEKATGVLVEGASNIEITDSSFDITGDSATAINAHVDWMGNIPSNIIITQNNITIDTTGDANILYFGNASDVTITDNEITATGGSHIMFNVVPNASVTDNYILVGEELDGIFGNYAVNTTEDDTVVENNTPVSKVIDDLNNQLEELENKTAELEEKNAELENKTAELENKTAELEEKNAELEDKIAYLTELLEQLNAAKATSIVIDPVNDKINQKINITGSVVSDEGMVIANANVNVTIDGVEQNVTTDGRGTFTVTTKFTTTGNKTIIVNYAGNDKYNASTNTVTVDVVKNDVVITIDDIADVAYGQQAVITGTLTDGEGNLLYNTNLKVTINGKTVNVKTDKKGVFTITTKATTMGENSLTVAFAGNNYYNTAEESATFNVVQQNVIITIDEIKEVGYGDTAVITGKVTDANGNVLYNTNLKVTINGKTVNVKTDKNGVFTITTKATTIGECEVTVALPGNTYYNASSASATYNVVKMDVIVSVDSFTYTSGNFTITGKFTDKNGNALYNSNVLITLNGKNSYAKTDSNGVFTFNGNTALKQLTYSAGYVGSTYYNAYEGTKTTVSFA